ncbi:MAG TPA: helix-turn-helix domain-containing protein, partial [Pseudonocardiaceae bacterium]|nr:helix-turn-helix domain-containing protein [Pseudonocardiaceae bacterium]
MPRSSAPNAVLPASRLAVHTTQNGVNIRSCASTSCAVVGTANSGNAIDSWCFVVGGSVNGNLDWDLVWDPAADRGGFISETLLNNTSQFASAEVTHRGAAGDSRSHHVVVHQSTLSNRDRRGYRPWMPGPVQSIERAAAILRLLARGSGRLGVGEIASSLELAKGTAHG